MVNQELKTFKILLVDPPVSAADEYGSMHKVSNIIPNLGLASVAAMLRQRGFTVKIIDCSCEGIFAEQLVEIVRGEKPLVVGFSATLLSLKSAKVLARALRRAFPEITLVIGGPQVSALPLESMQGGDFDLGVIGEGEFISSELFEALAAGKKDFSGIKGIVYRAGESIKFTPPAEPIHDLSIIPYPANDLLPRVTAYRYSPISTLRYPCAHVLSSRGCPFTCNFCDKTVTGSRFRVRSARDVAFEIEELVKTQGVREIKFFDDNFTFDFSRVYELCDLMDKRKIKVSWSCVAHAARVDKDLLSRMKRSGCWQIVYGLESGNQKILDSMNKPLKLTDARNAVRLSKQAGLNVRATFIFGFPGETLSTLKDTLNFSRELNLDTVSFYVFTPYPGSRIYKELKDRGEIIHNDYEQYRLIIDHKHYRPAYLAPGLSIEELLGMVRRSYRDYYLRPQYIFSQLKNLGSINHWKRYLRCVQALI